MTISKEQWNGIQNTLSGLYGEVKFRMPSGEDITVNKRLIAENKMALIVWINGERSDAWGLKIHDEYRSVTELVWRRKTYRPGASIIRRASKTRDGQRWLKRKENAYVHEVVEYRVCYFNTAASLVRQYRKIEGLELVTPVSEVMKNAEG
ncbi:hypothetical protein ABWM31_005515 [Citrobacter koseri]|uniref:hypothetical protein n=1 Tax=Citrobacter koseri TaxID=545 RepID=UPI001BE218AC|nr:hypothetical protein [Citrobacter koseri]MEB3109991.1 hypothetical protein [Citrobacter koseri]HBD3031428.1 hypothetical protein [Citrobacter koseri]HBD3038010.1 hypothetical protein [Citrobacter koseri]HBD3189761.1 hypothetical protein [Citrobacter koseri]HBD3275683.1 hypothetical protein [Citrobacter koseri]